MTFRAKLISWPPRAAEGSKPRLCEVTATCRLLCLYSACVLLITRWRWTSLSSPRHGWPMGWSKLCRYLIDLLCPVLQDSVTSSNKYTWEFIAGLWISIPTHSANIYRGLKNTNPARQCRSGVMREAKVKTTSMPHPPCMFLENSCTSLKELIAQTKDADEESRDGIHHADTMANQKG